MAARSPRKTFASPFVVTLAAIPACFTTSNPPPPDPPRQPPPVEARPTEPAPPPGEVVVTNPPRPSTGGTSEPQQPQTYNFDQRWTVVKSGDTCRAMAHVECPKPTKPGGPVPTCNPPPPMKMACPDGWDGSEALTVVRYANTTECMIEPAPMKCPAGAKCNPPPPRKVACPTYQ